MNKMNKGHKIIFDEFIKILDERFSKNILTNEDSIRYTFYHVTTTKGDYNPLDIILEYPHNVKMQRKTREGILKIDIVIGSKEKRGLIIEFKYQRGKKNVNSIKKGDTYLDIYKLRDFDVKDLDMDNFDKYFVYICDEIMAEYLSDNRKSPFDIFDSCKNTPQFLDKKVILEHGKKFANHIEEYFLYSNLFFDYDYQKYYCGITNLISKELQGDNYLRVYRIENKDFNPD